MLCRCDGMGPTEGQLLSELTRMTCGLCRSIEKAKRADLFPPDIRAWWEAHKKDDREREERERANAEAERQRKLSLFEQLKAELGK